MIFYRSSIADIDLIFALNVLIKSGLVQNQAARSQLEILRCIVKFKIYLSFISKTILYPNTELMGFGSFRCIVKSELLLLQWILIIR